MGRMLPHPSPPLPCHPAASPPRHLHPTPTTGTCTTTQLPCHPPSPPLPCHPSRFFVLHLPFALLPTAACVFIPRCLLLGCSACQPVCATPLCLHSALLAAWVQLCSVPAFPHDQPCVLFCHISPTHFCVSVSHHPSRHCRSAARALAAAARRTVCLPGVAGGAAGLVPQQRTRRAMPGGATLASRAMEVLLGLATGGGWAQCCGCRRQPAGPAAPSLPPSFLLSHPSVPPLPASSLPISVSVHGLPLVSTAHLASPFPSVSPRTCSPLSACVFLLATCTPPCSGSPPCTLPNPCSRVLHALSST